MKTAIFHFDEAASDDSTGFATKRIFEQPTSLLRKLHCHVTRLAPGAGYAEHVDAHDVAILMLSGRVETLGQEVRPNGVIYYAAGEKHGMRNVGEEPAHYLVFEFHAPAIDFRQRLRRHVRPVAKRVLKDTARVFGVDLGQVRASILRTLGK